MSFLSFLAEPGFVIPWYLFGILAAAWVWHDLRTANTPLKQAIQWAWPIIVLFFSVIGLALYFATARAPGVGRTDDEDRKKELHARYERSMLRRVNGAVIHCVAGDGLGIMTAMVIARITEMSFWQEFWFEYLVGFAFGWFIFQFKSMTMMTDSKLRALAMAFRAEFFSMLTVMGGMGAVMAFVTPMVAGLQPKPTTAAFWGFGMLGLLVGYVFTFPMNWMLVKIGWKHGMGPKDGARPAHEGAPRYALFATMCVLGAIALVLPGWAFVERQQHEREVARAAADTFASDPRVTQAREPVERGLDASLAQAADALAHGDRSRATAAVDAAFRTAQVMRAAGRPRGHEAEMAIRHARRALQDGQPQAAASLLEQASARGQGEGAGEPESSSSPTAYAGAPLLDASGAVIGEVVRVEGERALVATGGVRDFLGWWDIGGREAWMPVGDLVLGPAHAVGKTYAMLPALGNPESAIARDR